MPCSRRWPSTRRSTGDIRENALVPKEVIFRQSTFWTSHFGGVYIFIEDGQTTVIGNPSAKGFRRTRPWQVAYIDIKDHARVYDFLAGSGRIDPPRGSWIEKSGLIEDRALMLATFMAMEADPKADLSRVDPRWASAWVAKNAALVERDGRLPLMNWVKREAPGWGSIDMDEIDPAQSFPDQPRQSGTCRFLSRKSSDFGVSAL